MRSHQHGERAAALGRSQRLKHLFGFAANADTDDGAILAQQHRVHLHDVRIGDRLDIQTDAHKPDAHFLCHQPRAAPAVNIDMLFLGQRACNALHLLLVNQRIALTQQFLIGVQHGVDMPAAGHALRGHAAVFVIDQELTIAGVAAFLRKTRQRRLGHIKLLCHRFGRQISLRRMVDKEIRDILFQRRQIFVIGFDTGDDIAFKLCLNLHRTLVLLQSMFPLCKPGRLSHAISLHFLL